MNFDRRKFVQLASAAMAAPIARAAEASVPAVTSDWKPKSSRPKNVVLMLCDDLGFGDLGCYGSKLKTPNLDRMSAGGLRCVHYDSAHPLCSASRAAVLTGRYAQRSNTAAVYFPADKTGMDLGEKTLGNLFRDSGYRTMAIGKWHLGHTPEYLPTNRGFDSYLGVPYSIDMQPLPLLKDTVAIEENVERHLLTPRYTEAAVNFIHNADEKPFFLYMAFSYPHEPAAASNRFEGVSGFGNFGDAVEEIDWSAGEVFKALESRNMLSETLIIFTSDHGPWFQGSPGYLRGRKGSTFEGGFRVPFLAHWPDAIEPGRISDRWASSLDIVPTLTALCHLKPSPNPLDGVDISGLLMQDADPSRAKSVLYFNPKNGNRYIHCARKGPWKLRVAQNDGEIYINDYADGKIDYWLPLHELYQLDTDPAESYDVAKFHPEIVRDILDDLRSQIRGFPDTVKRAFTELTQNIAQKTTPSGAAPRPPLGKVPAWQYEPEDRR